jgi:photosystem II stability/assembly factor-like uncharacterized protein
MIDTISPKERTMKTSFRWTVFFAMIIAGFLVAVSLAPGSFSQSAALQRQRRESEPQERRPEPRERRSGRDNGKNPIRTTLVPLTEENEENDDPDLPPGMAGKIDKETYLRARGDYIDMLRGRDGDVPPDAREQAIAEMDRQAKALKRRVAQGFVPEMLSSDWVFLGPAPIPLGQTSNTRVPVSGRTISIAVHPTDPDTVYVGTAQGGLYKSTDGGTHWTALFPFDLETLAIGAITIDPTDSNIVYIGTGENSLSADSFGGKGLYIIRNANSPSPTLGGPYRLDGLGNDVFTGRSIGRILVNPLNNNTIFVVTAQGTGGNPNTSLFNAPRRGLYRSMNAQAGSPTFEQVTITGVASPNDRNVIDAGLDPANPNVLVLSLVGASSDGGLYRTANALDPTPTFTRTLTIPDGSTIGRAELYFNRNQSSLTIYAATGEISSATLGGPTCSATTAGLLRRSTDGGLTWSTPLPGSTGFCGGQCFYDMAIAVTPDNQTIHLGGAARGGSGSCTIEVMKRSTNGGATFARNDNTLHADEHALAIAPSNPNFVYTGSDGGIWRSTNNGTTWVSLNNPDFSATQFQSVSVHPFDRYFLMGGTQDNGTNCLAPNGITWTHCQDGDGGYAAIDSNAPDTTNVLSYHTFFNQANSQIGFERATSTAANVNGIFSWTFKGCSGTTSNNGFRCADNTLFYAPLELGPGNPNTLYFGTDRLYRSTNRGDNMTLVSQGPLVPSSPAGSGVVVTTIGISPQDDNVRIVGMRDGEVFATTTGSSTLTNVTGANFPAPNPADTTRNSIGRAVIDPNNKFTAYITFTSFSPPPGQQIFKTTNLNDPSPTWVPSSNGIPRVPVSSIAVDPQDSNSLYAGTDIGVYHSSDGGANWLPYGNGLPKVAVFDVKISNVQRYLRVATHGRGIWEIGIPGRQLPVIRTAPPTIVAEGCSPGNGVIDPGEEVTVNFGLSNIAGGSTEDLVVTLLPTGGVTFPSAPEHYGEVGTTGVAAFRSFHFSNSASCGGTIILTFHLQDGDLDLGNFSFPFTLGVLQTMAPTFAENFDGVSAPTLPSGWTTARTGGPAPWVTSTGGTPPTLPNGAFGAASTTAGNSELVSPVIAVSAAPASGGAPDVRVSFSNSYNTETGADGAVLEISVNGGAYQDIIAAGGSFVDGGGYSGAITSASSAINGRQAWTGSSNGFVTTTVILPPSAYGQNAQLKWRLVTDTGTSPTGGGIRIDSVTIFQTASLCCGGPCLISCPTNVSAAAEANECSALVTYPAATYTGNCGTVTSSPASGSSFPVGDNTVTVTDQHLDGSTESCSFTVTVNDTEPPIVSAATVDTPILWPANHQMEMVTVNYTATDNCTVDCVLTVTSNEPSNGLGDGDTSPDWEVVDAHHVRLRAERSGTGTGRVYTITVTCTDSGGHTVVRTATVRVPRSMGKGGPSIN